jgi:rhodanese-related sulfurtransferase
MKKKQNREGMESIRILAGILTVIVLVAAAGCGARKSEPPGAVPQAGDTQVTAETADETEKPATDYRNLTPDEFRTYQDNHPGIFLLDVRGPDEWEGELGHLDGAVLIPVDELDARLDELPSERNSTIMVYCRSGRRSARAAWILFLQGYERILNLDGGLTAYRDDGL